QQDLAADVDRDLLGEVTAGDGGGDVGDVADLRRQVGGHKVDVVGEVLPGAGDAGHLRLAARRVVGTHLTRHAGDLAREAVELVHHRVQRLFQAQDLAAHVDGDLARQVTTRDCGRHLGDVADLGGQVASHRVDAVGEVLPGAGDAGHL